MGYFIQLEYLLDGEVAEWSKANDSKSFDGKTVRGFESHPLRILGVMNKMSSAFSS